MNIAEILKNVPKDTKLYSPAFGEVKFKNIYNGKILTTDSANIERAFYSTGNFYKEGECMLFPSRENRDWDTFKKFDINTLKPFDKVLVRDDDTNNWYCNFYSYYRNNTHYNYGCISSDFHQCIPYNNETKHLVGTDKDCPEYYKTW